MTPDEIKHTRIDLGSTMSTKEQIAATQREIERLKNLPPSTTRRRAGSGNPGIKAVIARQERRLEILHDQLRNEEQQTNAKVTTTQKGNTMTTKTRKPSQVEAAFLRFCTAHGFKRAADSCDVGGMLLQHGPNGYTIAQVVNENGGQRRVFGWKAYPRGQFIAALDLASEAAEFAKGQ